MSANGRRPPLKGALLGLAAATLFGGSMPMAKALLFDVQPFLLAGLFYLGSGIGLGIWYWSQSKFADTPKQAPLRKGEWPWLGGAILFGGILAELSLMFGLKRTGAGEASLLLNLEGAFSALIAWVIFREHVNYRVLGGMVLLTLGAMVLSVGPDWRITLSLASLCVIGACLGWAVDNNMTRRVSHADPVLTASCKGSIAGMVNTAVGFSAGATLPSLSLIVISLLIGFLSYGVSLVLYIFSMRHIGTARASAYFSAAPFIGAAASIAFLHEPVTAGFVAATLLMGTGIWLHLTEEHGHVHTHEPVTHEHTHVHDEHHQHEHEPGVDTSKPHSHAHTHQRLTHSHPHHPDIHHRHEH